jgi:lincosamide nucleotidyltransferase A/C/D/E
LKKTRIATKVLQHFAMCESFTIGPGIPQPQNVMTSADVLEIYSSLDKLGVHIWVDGGWGVDALLEEQTRPHKDLDIAIQEKDLATLEDYFSALGYRRIKRDIERPFNFVLGNDRGHEVDVHVIVLDHDGNGIYGPLGNGQMYPSDSLKGRGRIDGQPVSCISAEWMVKFHSGYELKEKDFSDVSALCRKFGIDLPQEYARFMAYRNQSTSCRP